MSDIFLFRVSFILYSKFADKGFINKRIKKPTKTIFSSLRRIYNACFRSRKGDLRSILIEGHTDNQDPAGKIAERYPTNWELSSARAANVVNYLIYKGVMSGRLTASGYADIWPDGATWSEVRSGKVDDMYISEKNTTPDQRTNNRRIKIIFGVK